MKYKTSLVKKENIAFGTMIFYFKKPEGFSFKAGQFLDWTLIDPKETDAEGNTRAFSIVSAPHEEDIALATRIRDTAFKRTLNNSDEIQMEIEGPIGSFVLHQNKERPAVFLIGGIGITPVFSILKDATKNLLPHNIYLFYSNRKEEDAPFLVEIEKLTKENKNFHFVPTMTASDSWRGEKGYINKEMLEKYNLPKNSIYYLAGPQQMVSTMRSLLNGMEVSDDDIRSEGFSGY